MKTHLRRIFGSGREFSADGMHILTGAVLYSCGLMLFGRAAGIALGGLSGISLVINHFTGFPVGTATILLNLPLLLFSWRVLGRDFIIKSTLGILAVNLVNDLAFSRMEGYAGSAIVSALFCGALMGAGLGLVYSRGYSTGGMDFLLMPAHRMLPRFTLPQLSMTLDAIIICIGGLLYRNLDSMLYGIVATVISGQVMDRVMNGARSEKMAMIVTDDGPDIAGRIGKALDRGSTLVPVKGAYTGQPRDMILCVCSRQQVVSLRRLVHEADPRALVTITEVTEAFGEGFQSPDKESL